MIWTTRTIGILLTMAMLTGGAVWGVHSLIASAGGAGSDYGLDTNGNGKFEWLVVEAEVSFPQAGTWDVSAELSGSTAPSTGVCGGGVPVPVPMMDARASYPPIAWAYGRYFFPAGLQTVRMAFSGTDLARAGVDGPFRVHALLSLGPLPYAGIRAPDPIPSGESIEWNYTTHAYAAKEFEMPVRPAFFAGAHNDSAVDVDSDGLADFLQLTAEVHVNVAGHYMLNGFLSMDGGADVARTIAYGYRDFDLATGNTSVFLRFRGDQIRQAGIDGPWNFTLTLFGGVELPYAGSLPPASDVLRPIPISYPEMLCGSTGPYRSAAFDDTVELLRYTGRFEEQTPDRDSDGLYDALVVRAEVEVFIGAGFDASGILRAGAAATVLARATNQTWLREGVQWVDFTFPGPEIRGSGVDGPYEATLSLTPGRLGIDPTTAYGTKAYRAADFDDSVRSRGYWIGNLTASPVGASLSIVVEVVRGPDMLAVVFEDTLTVTVADSAGSIVESFQTKVVLASSGSSQTVTFSTASLPAGTYAVTAVLGPADRPVDIRTVVVTI